MVLELLSQFGPQVQRARLLDAMGDRNRVPEERAKALHKEGRYSEALNLVKEILARLNDSPCFKRVAMLDLLGRCHLGLGRPDDAANCYQLALNEANGLPDDKNTQILRATLALDMGDALQGMGEQDSARKQFMNALVIARAQGHTEMVTFGETKLGSVTDSDVDWRREVRNWATAVAHARRIKDKGRLAGALQRLGFAYEAVKDWKHAEQAYRESAEILDAMPGGAGHAWNRLSTFYMRIGRLEEALPFIIKAVNAYSKDEDYYHAGLELHNLATMLSSAGRLDEAAQAAEKSLEMLEQVNANIADVNRVYKLLIEVTSQRGDQDAAQSYRRRAHDRNVAFFASLHEVKPYRNLVGLVLGTMHGDEEQRLRAMAMIRENQVSMRRAGEAWNSFSTALDQLLDGIRDPEILQIERQGSVQTLLLKTFLAGEQDPEAVTQGLFSDIVAGGVTVTDLSSVPDTDKQNDRLIDRVLSDPTGKDGSPEVFSQILDPRVLRDGGLLQRLADRIAVETDVARKKRLEAMRELGIYFLSQVERP
jgi:tetratricopeptide (TPR) repeat protein